jgi:hypothetical protein
MGHVEYLAKFGSGDLHGVKIPTSDFSPSHSRDETLTDRTAELKDSLAMWSENTLSEKTILRFKMGI